MCAVSLTVTGAIMYNLWNYGFVECPTQISELRESINITTSDFTKLHLGCSEERSDIKRKLSHLTWNLIAKKNEINNITKSLNANRKIPLDLKDKLDLIEHLDINSTSYSTLLKEAIQELTEVYDNWVSVGARIKELNRQNMKFIEVAGKCTSQLKDITQQLREEKLQLQSINQSYTTLFNEVNQLKIDQNLQDIAYDYTSLMTEMNRVQRENRELKEIVDNHPKNLNNCRNTFQHLKKLLGRKKFSNIWNHCSNETLECSPCMKNWAQYSSKCFLLSDDKKSWLQSRHACVILGGDLAVVYTQGLQKFVTNLVKRGKEAAWIGMIDLLKEAQFMWINSKLVETTYWGPGEPNNMMASWDKANSGQDCVTIEPRRDWTNSWDDVICVGARHYVCEYKAVQFLPTPAREDKSHL